MNITKLSPKQKKVLKWCHVPRMRAKYSAIVCDGAVRSGKTVCMIVSYIHWAMRFFDGAIFGICGKTVQSVERNIIMPLMEMQDISAYYSLSYTRSTKLVTVVGNGHANSFYVFGGKDESSYTLIQGITLSGVFFDEVALMPRSFVEQAIARTLSVSDAKLWFNCNPASPEHWFYKEWIESPKPDTLHLHFLMQDNPIMTPEAIAKAEKRFTGVFYERYILGLWVLTEGLVYDNFSKDLHTVTELPRCCTHPDEADGRYFISIDYGTLNPFSAGLWCVADGVATRIAEYYYSGRDNNRSLTDEEYYIELEKLCERIVTRYDGRTERSKYPIEYIVVDPSAASFIECVRRHGRFSVRSAVNNVLPGIRTTAALLKAGKLKFYRGCENCIREFGLYRWDEKSSEDAVIKENDHAMDDMRYFCLTILCREFRWDNWEA